MNLRQRLAGGFMCALCLGFLLAATVLPVEAGGGAVQLIHGKRFSSGSVLPGVPQTGRPLYAPPVFMDRSTPLSERPLAPIGGGTQVAPGAAPSVGCPGEWVRVDHLWHRCSSR
jgi:hypothetical protein